MAKLVALCKRRGIVFQSSEIYGGVGSTYDYGPYGVEIKNNISKLWWNDMTLNHDEIVGLDSAIILHPKVWEASGHLSHFTDPMVECKNCKKRFRLDEFYGLVNELTVKISHGERVDSKDEHIAKKALHERDLIFKNVDEINLHDHEE